MYNENKIDIIIPTLLLTISCGLSFLCLLSLIVYTLIKPLLGKNRIMSTYKITFSLDRMKDYVNIQIFLRILLYKNKYNCMQN